MCINSRLLHAPIISKVSRSLFRQRGKEWIYGAKSLASDNDNRWTTCIGFTKTGLVITLLPKTGLVMTLLPSLKGSAYTGIHAVLISCCKILMALCFCKYSILFSKTYVKMRETL